MACLGKRVFDETGVRFLGLWKPKCRLRDDLHTKRLEDLADLAQLARIVACDDQFPEHARTLTQRRKENRNSPHEDTKDIKLHEEVQNENLVWFSSWVFVFFVPSW
jgi:hypothetical protein